jgi:hypothetical protein
MSTVTLICVDGPVVNLPHCGLVLALAQVTVEAVEELDPLVLATVEAVDFPGADVFDVLWVAPVSNVLHLSSRTLASALVAAAADDVPSVVVVDVLGVSVCLRLSAKDPKQVGKTLLMFAVGFPRQRPAWLSVGAVKCSCRQLSV